MIQIISGQRSLFDKYFCTFHILLTGEGFINWFPFLFYSQNKNFFFIDFSVWLTTFRLMNMTSARMWVSKICTPDSELRSLIPVRMRPTMRMQMRRLWNEADRDFSAVWQKSDRISGHELGRHTPTTGLVWDVRGDVLETLLESV